VATAALTAVLGASACGGSTAPSHPTSPGASESAGATASIKGVPFYHPATVRSHTGASATLTSPDPVTKVTDYYVSVVNAGGWTRVSKSITPYSGHLTIKKSGQGATISVAPSGSGSVINISAYPTA
jgi:hypothetical protein